MAKKATQTREKLLGYKGPKTLDSSIMLSLAYSLGGQWKEVEELQIQMVETCKQVLGPDHPDTVARMVDLVSTHWTQGR
jgi:hypothetical protein